MENNHFPRMTNFPNFPLDTSNFVVIHKILTSRFISNLQLLVLTFTIISFNFLVSLISNNSLVVFMLNMDGLKVTLLEYKSSCHF